MRKKKTLLLGVDGCRPDCVLAAKTSNIMRLAKKSAYSFHAQTCEISLSGPSWTSCVTGVWEEKHNVFNNDTIHKANWDRYPSIFQRIKFMQPTSRSAIVASWNKFIHMKDQVDTAWFLQDPEQDQLTAFEICAVFKAQETPDIIFGHLDAVDHAGHHYGYGKEIPEYMEAINSVDECIKQIMEQVNRRRSQFEEDWLVCICTDHGGTLFDPNIGTNGIIMEEGDRGFHGLNIPEHRNIWVIIDGDYIVPGEIIPSPNIVDIPATVLYHMTGMYSELWNMDGIPLGIARSQLESSAP